MVKEAAAAACGCRRQTEQLKGRVQKAALSLARERTTASALPFNPPTFRGCGPLYSGITLCIPQGGNGLCGLTRLMCCFT